MKSDKIYNGMVDTPALPRLRKIAEECDGRIEEMKDYSNWWPNRNNEPGHRCRGEMLIAQGWDNNILYGVVR